MKEFISPAQAVNVLSNAGLVALPTETVYGLAADIRFPKAVESIFKTKGRPYFDPLIVHVPNIESINNYVLNPHPYALMLAKHFWPGPLTLIFQKNKDTVSDMITSGSDTVAIRIPKHPVILDVLSNLKSAVAAPSANPFKKTSPTSAEHVQNYFPNLDIVDGGPCEFGLESTIVKVVSDHLIEILRPGHITKKDIIAFFLKNNIDVKVEENFDKEGPGSMKEHYQPSSPLFVSTKNEPLSQDLLTKYKNIKYLQMSVDPFIFAREFYSTLINESKNHDALVLNWNHDETDSNWSTVFNRLKKAASNEITPSTNNQD